MNWNLPTPQQLDTWLTMSGACLTIQKRGSKPWVARVKGTCPVTLQHINAEGTGAYLADALNELLSREELSGMRSKTVAALPK